ncbi:MAG: lasso RiPP family leader peptide-containing protein [Bacillota bacterium]
MKEYQKPLLTEIGSLTTDTQFNVSGAGRDGAFPDKSLEDAIIESGDGAVFGS